MLGLVSILIVTREPFQVLNCSIYRLLCLISYERSGRAGGSVMSSRLCAVSQAPIIQSAEFDLILPCQYCDISSGYGLSGEQRLMLALLTDALNVYQKGALSRLSTLRRLYVDAERWILADRADCNALSFIVVCDALGINPQLLRRRIINWKHAVCSQQRGHSSSRLRLKITRRERSIRRRINSPTFSPQYT